jgi:hypothetical protein
MIHSTTWVQALLPASRFGGLLVAIFNGALTLPSSGPAFGRPLKSNVRRLMRICYFFLSVLLLGGCASMNATPPPVPQSTAYITLSLAPDLCCTDRYKVTDPQAVRTVISAYRSLNDGWKSDRYLALTRGWFTSPSLSNRAEFFDVEGHSLMVVSFDGSLVEAYSPTASRIAAYHLSNSAVASAILSAKREAIVPAPR